MYDQERIEEINFEQLATATDRLLLAARFGRARPSSPSLARASTHRVADECTVFTRRLPHAARPWRKFTTTALVTSLVSVGSAIGFLL